MLASLRGLDTLVLYFAAAVALFFTFASVWYASFIKSTPKEKRPTYVIARKQASIFWTIFFYVAGVSIWTMLTFGRGQITIGMLVYGGFALVFSLLSVINAWRESDRLESSSASR